MHTVDLKVDDAVTRDEMDSILTAGMRAFPENWHVLFKPLHFQPGNAARYELEPRKGDRGGGPPAKGSYTKHKLNRYGHTLPLVYSGRGRDAALAGNRVEASPLTSAAIVSGRVWNLRNIPHSKVNLLEEVTRVLDGENAELDRLAQFKVDAADLQTQRAA